MKASKKGSGPRDPGMSAAHVDQRLSNGKPVSSTKKGGKKNSSHERKEASSG